MRFHHRHQIVVPRFNPWAPGPPTAVFDGDYLRRYGDGGAIPQWEDLSGRGNHLVQGTGVSQPLAKVNNGGFWGANFDGVNDSMDSATLWLNNELWTVFLVQQTSGDNIMMADSAAGNYQIRIGQSGNNISMFDGGNNPNSGTMTVARTDISLVEYSHQATTNIALFWQNGKDFSGAGTINAGLTLNRLGTASGAGAAWVLGTIYYALVYPFRMNDAARKYVERGLCQRYRLPLLG